MAFLAVYGHVNVDYILLLQKLPGPETTLPVERSLYRLGGTAGNIARATASLGVPTSLAGFIGEDFPAEFQRTLESSGLDLQDLRRIAGPTPKVWLFSIPGGSQSAVIDQGVMGDGFERLQLDLAWLDSEWVHFATGPTQDWLRTAAEASAARKRISFDPAQELSYRWSSRDFERLLNLADIFFCNEAELQRALDLLSYGDPIQLLDHADRVIVTRGARGAELLTRDERITVPACPVRGIDKVETTGAGDVYRAGLYAALHHGRKFPDALRFAAATTSLFLESQGERFPSWEGVKERLETWHP